jgi:F-type H+-transporting ATPase subunit b
MGMDFSWNMILYQSINFIILMVILGYVFNKFIRPFMQKRADDIKGAFVEIDKQKQSIEGMKKEYASQLDGIKTASRAEIEKAVTEGARIKDEIRKEAEKESGRFMDKARREIEQEKQKLLSDVRREVATLTMAATRQLIKKEVDDATNKKLVEDFLADLGGGNNLKKN